MQPLPPGYEFHRWTPGEVARFWDFVAKVQPDAYFAKQVGPKLVRHFRNLIAPARHIVDFGCGAGFFLEALAVTGKPIHGFDVSEGSLSETRRRMERVASFAGAFGLDAVAAHTATFDLGFCLEVVEHLEDEPLEQALASMHAMLQPGGRLVVTTQNEEDLSRDWILCPDSGKIIHRWQHVRSWSAESLSARLVASGFAVERAYACNALALGFSAEAIARRIAYAAIRRKPTNLFVVARRT